MRSISWTAPLLFACAVSACKVQQPVDIPVHTPTEPGPEFLPAASSGGQDLGFRWDDSVSSCKNAQGVTGLNPAYLGECSLHKGYSFAQQALSNLSFKGSSFISVAFHMADASSVNFAWARFQNANFTRTQLPRADFSHSTHAQSVFTQAVLTDATFEDASLPGAAFIQVDAASPTTNFEGADLSSANFTSARLTEARLRDTRLMYAVLKGADLSKADLTNALLTGATFDGATKLPFAKDEAIRRGMRFLP